MAFRYINPGYVSLLDSDVVANEVAGTTYSKTGVAFSQTNSSAGITIPNFAQGDDFWAKFDVYLTSGTSIYLKIPRTKGAGFRLSQQRNGDTYLYLCYNYTEVTVSTSADISEAVKQGAINTIVFHVKLGTSDSLWDFSINGTAFQKTGYNMSYSTSYEDIANLYSTSAQNYFSNIIISNEEISPKEQCIALPISQTITDMTTGESGIYIADAANQTLLQSVDVAELIQSYGASSAVTGVALYGNPAYKTATGLANLTALSKAGGSVVEHDTIALSDDTTSVVMDGWGLSGVSISDLQNMQFGWKAGE